MTPCIEMNMKTILLSLLLSVLLSSCGEGGKASAQDTTVNYSNWTTLTKGMEYREMDAPTKSFIGDSKISILRMDGDLFDFNIFSYLTYNLKCVKVIFFELNVASFNIFI